MTNVVQCEICQKWCSTKKGLLVHLGYCRERHTAIQDNANHLLHEYHPLKSSYNQGDHLNPFAVYDNSDISNSDDSVDGNNRNNTDDGYSSVEDGNANGYDDDHQSDVGDYHRSHGQCSTAVSKLQIRLNNVINTHKAPLRLYDDVVIC